MKRSIFVLMQTIFFFGITIAQVNTSTRLVNKIETRKVAELLCRSTFGPHELFDTISYYDMGGERTCDIYIYQKNNKWSLRRTELVDSVYQSRMMYFKYCDSIKNIYTYFSEPEIQQIQLTKYRILADEYLFLSTRPSEFISIYTSASENHYPVFEYREGLPEAYVMVYDIKELILNHNYEDNQFKYFGPMKLFITDIQNSKIINLNNPDFEIAIEDLGSFRYNSISVEEDFARVDSLWLEVKSKSLNEIISNAIKLLPLASHTIQNVPYFRQSDWTYILPPQNSCEVMAASSIFGRYDNAGYWNLVPQAWYQGPPNNNSAGFGFYPGTNEVKSVCGVNKNMHFGPETTVYYLAVDLGYSFCNGSTLISCTGSNDMQNKWPLYSNTRLGLSFSFDSDCGVLGGHYYSTIKSQINADKPMALVVDHYSWGSSGGPYGLIGWHAVAIIAYDESNSVGGDPIGVYINGNNTYNTVWWNYAQIRNDNDEITMTVTSGGSPGSWINSPSTGSPSNSSDVCAGNISFSWLNVNASSYRVQVSNSSSFSSYVYDFTTSSTSATRSITSTGTYYWRVMPRNSSNNWCHFNDNTFVFNVIQTPSQPGSISGNSSPCQSTNQTYSIASISGATSYTWTLPPGWSGSSTSTSINVTVGSSGGTISVTANNSCGSSAARTLPVSVTAIPSQPGSISGNTIVCQSSSQTYSISSVSGATSYTWTLPAGWSGSSTSTSIAVTVGSGSGTICVTANNSCGSSPSRCLSVTVSPVPAQPGNISGNTSPCQGTSETYSISSVSGAISYTWSLPAGWSGSSTSTSITVTVGSGSGSICVTANNSCGSSPSRCLGVTISPIPAQPGNISGNISPCQGTSETYSISSVSGATSYTWSLPAGWSGSSTSTSITVTVGSGSGTICVTANNSCGSSPSRCLNVTVSPVSAQPGNISGNSTPCQGTSEIYSISPVSGATSYTWTLPSGWSGSSTSTSITVTVGSGSGSICVTANNSCGSSPSRCLDVTVSPVPIQPGIISGNTNPCQGSSETYSISSVSGATTYSWTLPSGWSGSSTSTSITVTVEATSGSVCVTANNSCGSSPSRCQSVTVNPVPPQPGVISGNSSVCQGTPQTYSIQPVSGATSYTWSLPPGWTGSSTSTSIATTVGPNSGNISVVANNSCGPGPERVIIVGVGTIPPQPGEITGNTTTSQGITEIYSIEPVAGATSYSWTLPAGWSGNSTTTSITTTVGASGGSVTVAAVNACGTGTPSTKNVNVTATPLILVSPETLAFGNVNIGSSSVPQSYNVQGSNLTSNVLVSAPEGFSLSLSLSGPWNTFLSLVPNLGIVNTTVLVQFTPTAQVPYSGIITNASGGATTRNVAVTGTGDIPGLEVTPLSRSVASSSGNTIYDVTCNTSWTSLSSEPWCVVTGSGNGTGTITATYEANTTNASRTAFITVSTPGLPEVVVSLVQAGSEFEISARNLVQTAPNVLEFDVYLLDVDASAPFELASVQLGFLLNSGICAGGTLSAQYDNSGSGLLPVQQFTASASVVQTLAGYPNQTLIRLVGKTPPGTGNGTIISATSPGTLLTHFILTSTVPFTGNSTPDMTFTSSTVTVPLYATKVAAYIGGINTQLLVTPGANALIVGNPLLNGPPELSINPLIHDVDSEEGSVGFSLESNASWTAQSNQSWCSVTPSGFGSGTLTATYSANAGVARSAQITVTVAGLSPVVLTLNQQGYETKVLNLYALLEGLYNGNGTMDQAGDEYGAHFPSGVADLVNIELHDAADYGIIRLLITNVELGTNGIAIIDIPQEFSDSYYITIKHRNSIETTSASPVSFSEPVTDYAFDLPSKAHGNNMQLMVDGYYVIFGGDVNVDDAVDTGDMTLVDNESTNYTAGYVSEDVNGDGQVDTGDMIVVDNNAAQYVGAVFPASTSVLMVSTLPVNGITRTTATCGGNVIAQGPLPVIDRGVCWSTSPEPDVTDDHTSDGSGSGQFTSNLTNLTPGTLYYIRAYAVNSSETVYGSVITFYTVLYTNGNGLTDIHGNQYPTIVLGTQEWLAENLRVTKYSNGDNIPNVTNGTWSSLTTGAYRWYNDDEANYKNNYGGLYNWYAVTDSRKLCPSGWRSPNTADWATLSAFLGGPELAGGKMKSTRTSPLAHPRWDQPNAGATDISGFGGYPGGYCLHTGNFGESGLSGYWWNATPEGNNSATMRALLNTDDNLYADNSFRQAAFSARCIRETTTAAISTSSVTNITGVTAVCGGNITSDGGSQITQRGVCWSTDPDPTIEDFYTVNGSGTGSYESNMEGLSINTVYYVRAYAINGAGVAYGAGQAISFRTLFFVEGNGVTDNSGNNYSSVFLGTQEWMAENLRTANYRNGDAIPNVTNATEWIGLSTGAWCYYNNNSQLENPYGKYYNWYAVTDTRQLCPTGWQIPTDADWTVLTDFLGGIYTADERLKEADFAHWSPSGYNGDNSSGFTGLPGGRRHYTNGSSLYMSELGYHWSSTQATPTTAWCRVLGYQYSGVSRSEYNFKNGITVRCMRQVSTPVVVTNSINSITGISAMGGGTITSDGGSPVTQRGLCWSTASNPTIDGNHTSEGPGSGDFISTISGLTPNTVYYVRAYATNSAGTSYGNNQSFTSALFIPGLGVTDIDNNTYPTIILGTQEWMAENLKVTHYRNGDLIPNITEIAQWNSLSTGAFCWYNNDVNWKDAYGALYNWYTVADNRNVCPSGWHIPTDAEWTVLTNYLGGAVVAGGKLKSTRTTPDISPRWDLPNTGATNQSGFSGFPGGYREYDGAFNNNGQEGAWWGSTQGSSIGAYGRVLNFDNENTDRGNYFMKDGFSVRCLKD